MLFRSNTEGEMNELQMVKQICDEIERLGNKAIIKQSATATTTTSSEGNEEKAFKAERKDVISVAEAKRSTGYLESLGYSLKKLVWS